MTLAKNKIEYIFEAGENFLNSTLKALTKKATVKSVTHKGLTSKKKYSYKVRAFVKVNGKKYYSSFSKAITVKVR